VRVRSNFETFWDRRSFAVVGHTGKSPFPRLTYAALKRRGKTVFAIDRGTGGIDGDSTYDDLASLPAPVDAVVIETPPEETAGWVRRAAEAGVKDVWIHQGRQTPEALELAHRHGINLRHGTCAVMYLADGVHRIHRWVDRVRGVY
jgi:predicted CoA-binding protein